MALFAKVSGMFCIVVLSEEDNWSHQIDVISDSNHFLKFAFQYLVIIAKFWYQKDQGRKMKKLTLLRTPLAIPIQSYNFKLNNT